MSAASDEQRAEQMLNEQIDALLQVELDRVAETRFLPESLARRVTNAYNLPGKDSSADPRVKIITIAYVKARAKRLIQKSKNGLRIWIPCGGGQWQYAPATTARVVRVFRNDYQSQEQSAGARKDRLDQVLDAHAAAGLTDDDPIRTAYEAALSGGADEPIEVAA